jgi:hypothetical protein
MLFDTPDIHGKQIEVNTSTKDAMIVALENSEESASRKELAKKILTWFSAEVSKPPLTGNSELDKAAQMMMVEYRASDLWKGTCRFEERSLNEAKKTVIVDVKSNEVLAW